MLGRESRLSDPQDFKRVQEKGKVFQFTNFGIATFDREDTDPSRYGFVISVKVAKRAVDRNNVKRILSEAVRHLLVNSKKGTDVVFLAKPTIVREPTAVLTKEVGAAMKEIGLI